MTKDDGDDEIDKRHQAGINASEKAWRDWKGYRAKFKGDAAHEARWDAIEKEKAAYREHEAIARARIIATEKREAKRTRLLERVSKQLQSIQELLRDIPANDR